MWRRLRQLINAAYEVFWPAHQKAAADYERRLPDVLFETLTIVEKTPSNRAVLPRQFIEVVYKSTPRWSMFCCPCGCGEVISLPLETHHKPHWQVSQSSAGRPQLYPSVWRNKGCLSHFWIDDGRVFWCADSGKSPSAVRPDLYMLRSNRN